MLLTFQVKLREVLAARPSVALRSPISLSPPPREGARASPARHPRGPAGAHLPPAGLPRTAADARWLGLLGLDPSPRPGGSGRLLLGHLCPPPRPPVLRPRDPLRG